MHPLNSVFQHDWPKEDLQFINGCPICASQKRSVLSDQLVDNVYFCSPGKWSLWRCGNCSCAYLNPRPSEASIYRAYGNYATHQYADDRANYNKLSLIRKLKRRLVNGYSKWRYNAKNIPSTKFGVLVAFLIPFFKKTIDRQYRHLPKYSYSGALLDVGCGNGAFLDIAENCGWNATGLDFDPDATVNATIKNFKVLTGDLRYFSNQSELFDVITLAHVIEHIHDPTEALTICFNLLKPGGTLWIETPNIESYGQYLFKENWRGLEAPRHLVLFNRNQLIQLLRSSGFLDIKDCPIPSPSKYIYSTSYAMSIGEKPNPNQQISLKLKLLRFIADIACIAQKNKREFITLTAKKGPVQHGNY